MGAPRDTERAAPQTDVPVAAVLALLDLAAKGTRDEPEAVTDLLLTEHLDTATATQVGRRVRELQGAMARSHRRGQELAALFSSARELAELHDVDLLITRLVQRAHDLAGTDITYLSEFDETTRELRVRSTAGAVAPSFQRLRVPPHIGLASKIVETRAPQWTSRYEQLRDVPHDDSIDNAVRAEGLESIVGVPLIAGGRVLGVLFAANRTEHAFSPEEVSLLSAFADNVAVVLQSARLLTQARDAAAETQRAYDALADHVEAMERAGRVHEELTAAVLRGGGAADVARTLGAALERPVVILDETYAVLAASDDRSTPSVIDPPAVRLAITDSLRSGRCTPLSPPTGEFHTAVAVLAGEMMLGGLLIGDGAVELGAVEQRTIERAAQITALLTLKQDAVLHAEDHVRGELLGDLVSLDARRRASLPARLRARRLRPDDLRTVVIAVVAPEQRRAALRATQTVAAPSGLAGEVDGVVTLVVPESDPQRAATTVRDRLCAAMGAGEVLTVAAPPAESLDELSTRFTTARDCGRVLTALGIEAAAVAADAYLPYTTLFAHDPTSVRQFIDRTIGPVRRWDAERGTELLATLHRFVDCNASPARTARLMGVHSNTVLQRLDRITQLLGSTWRDSESFFRISVAVRLHTLSETLQGSSHPLRRS
ncbi:MULTISPECIES: helix-turn-helix domain-containing protein [Streptomyces]|uniref:helix-turn-helix domain-containing protein n=1 Tax=Streptomyces TaxID=1883 RepID=UPI00081F0668|nr:MULTISPECIES: GAF domain-containing protein [unclassified Streptomyces]AUA16615.1 GAF domain protein [Streptomyces sp. M56]MYU12332.1 GAF domain-containing protein [Streptomyces sp. SID8361]MYX54282.1 GAF domain-containing protein [Streptomyces sp. SID8382]SCF90585.1 PucR C-terminal helix-turn-helix domain-containing protein [Streptomyces sp. MnatMP-M27]